MGCRGRRKGRCGLLAAFALRCHSTRDEYGVSTQSQAGDTAWDLSVEFWLKQQHVADGPFQLVEPKVRECSQ